ncbi:hypothetical protein [Agarivorans sp. Z349TD_8]|uniref:hypothetical protein n=1 Tax=Agarivorans sp. Z349TD_8 TaxID=3421434 RepID=UPI003D7D8001
MNILIHFLFFILLSTSAFAKVCKKGQPCGNSCISWNKTCRIEQPTLFTHQNQIANNNTGEDVPTGRKIKDSITIEAEFGCMVTWTALVDFHLFKKNEEEVINDALYKIKLKSEFNN